jgi:cell division protein ZapA
MEDRISIDIMIAGRNYPLKIQKQDEDKVLRIVKNINAKIDQLKAQYDARDTQDYLATCLLQLTAQQLNSSNSNVDSQIEPQLKEIEALLAEIE